MVKRVVGAKMPRSKATNGVQDPLKAPLAPMSERQQMALVMQLTLDEAEAAAAAAAAAASPPTPPPPPPPPEERKRKRHQRNVRGETPLHVAAIRGDTEQVKKLLKQGEDPDVADFAGWTALHEACSYGWLPVVIVLVQGGANVNAKGLDDDTPLHDATTSGNLDMVTYLVENGADPNQKNAKGQTPADYAAQHIYDYFMAIKESSNRVSHVSRSRDDSSTSKKGGGNATGEGSGGKKSSMESLAQDLEGKEAQSKAQSTEKTNTTDSKDEGQVSSGVVSSSQDDVASSSKVNYYDGGDDDDDDEVLKKKKRKDEDREPMAKPAPPAPRGTGGRVVPGSKQPGPASKTGGAPVKGGAGGKGANASGKGTGASGKGTPSKGKSSGNSKGSGSQSKDRQKSPVASPKPGSKDDDEDGGGGGGGGGSSSGGGKGPEPAAPKVPPLKIVIPGGAGGSGSRCEQDGEGQRGSGKGRNSGVLPYVIPCTSTEGGASDSSDTYGDDKRFDGKGHGHGHGHDHDHGSSSVTSSKSESRGSNNELHPRKRKIKASKESKESHSRETSKSSSTEAIESVSHAVQHSNPYLMYIHIRKQIDQRQKSLFPVKPKPPKDFNKYLMNRCTYTLQSNVNQEPQVELPHNLPPQMKDEFISQEKERHRLRIQHLVEKEKLVLAVEQEILRVHGRAERAVANQSLPFSVCTMLRDKEVYNVIAPEQEEKRNAQRSRCNGRQINSWLQEVDDKWEKIKEGMLRRQHTEAQTLHAVQTMGWEWRLKEVGLCDYKVTPKIDAIHVPQIHVSNFDLPA